MITKRMRIVVVTAVLGLPLVSLGQERQTRRPESRSPSTAPVHGARKSENLRRASAGRAANLQEKLAIVEAMVSESHGDVQALDRAEAELATVLEGNARSAEANLLAGRIATLKNQPAAAAKYYRTVIALKSNNADAHLGLGNALTAMQDTAGADAAFARYRELIGLNHQ